MRGAEADAGRERRIVIMGAAGRDFHNFNVVYRNDPGRRVVAFTAAQIPGISGRRYPPALAGPRYPEGIPIRDESELASLCREASVDEVVFAYSDVAHAHVMQQASIALGCGASFSLLGPRATMLPARLPVVAVCAVRTGCGKSQVARWLARRFRDRGLRPAVLRHPMPYGVLERQDVQRFACLEDLDASECTVEEREEYEPHITAGSIVFAGLDYARILERAEAEADIIIWDGGNNDFSFIAPTLTVVLVDPLRAGHESAYHPGAAVLRMADIVVVAKCNAASEEQVRRSERAAVELAPDAPVVRGASAITLQDVAAVAGRRVLVIEDGPTMTHGGLATGAGHAAAVAAGAREIVDPRTSARGGLASVFADHPHIGPVLPAVGYSSSQLADLAATIEASGAEVVVSGTPADIARLIRVSAPIVRARYEFMEPGTPRLGDLVDGLLRDRARAGARSNGGD